MLTSCVSFQQAQWPSGVPARSYFEAYYRSDPALTDLQTEDEYLGWVRQFYEGVQLVPGWLEVSRRILARSEESAAAVKARLDELGRKISAEWAKDNSIRLITTRNANVWREALMESLEREELDSFLQTLSRDVDALLTRELQADAIHYERYYEDEYF